MAKHGFGDLDFDFGEEEVEVTLKTPQGVSSLDDIDDDELFKKKKNKNLHKAKSAKNDEFYTQLSDIEAELSHYPIDYFKDKVIYCPTDVAVNTGSIKQSNFVKYFQLNAHRLQFKKLIATCLVEKAAGDNDEDWGKVQNCYVLERKNPIKVNTLIHSHITGQGDTNPVTGEIEETGRLFYQEQNGGLHPMPHHIVNQAVTEPNGRYKIVARFIDHYNADTGKPVLGIEDKGLTWKYHTDKFGDKTLRIKWVKLHPDGNEEMLRDDCYFYNNPLPDGKTEAFTDYGLIARYDTDDKNPIDIHPSFVNKQGRFVKRMGCYETPEEDKATNVGSVCLLPPEYYNYEEVDYEETEYSKHCPSDAVYESGDFHSDYCTRLLNEADIVVTNPPFSLFRDFFKWLMDNKKDFILVGNQNAISYKEIFPYLRENKCRTGFGGNISMIFQVTYKNTDEKNRDYVRNHGYNPDDGYIKVPAISWFTTLDLQKHHDPLLLTEKYSPDRYPKYDNYDAIEVSKVNEIPCDYYGVMGVPITYMYKHNPDQFDIVALRKNPDGTVEPWTVERESEFNNTVLSNGDRWVDEQSKGYYDKWQEHLRTNPDTKEKPVDICYPNAANLTFGLVNDYTVNGKKGYVRILIRRRVNS